MVYYLILGLTLAAFFFACGWFAAKRHENIEYLELQIRFEKLKRIYLGEAVDAPNDY